ncbi:MAG: c-type cytochrome domain-containing protein [Bacteroidota bacterium]|nr:c-type cytochrome domain-containing protein [Bacteroidota bacterium]MDP4212488.1 c-type cytochrome domain-containing protein [Bacteroidota bacterium]MDP4248938.1 c-type cytochrome domain-containing protein [Bacteroidota bacterium]
MLLSVTTVFGRLHPVLVHLPIGILLIGILLQWLHNRESHAVSIQVIKIVFVTGMLCAWISCLTGYVLSTSGDYEEGLVDWHMWMGIAVAVTASLIYWKIVRQETDILYKGLSIMLLLLIMITGHLGGSLTHGSDYLTAALSEVDDAPLPVHKPISNIQEAQLYADVIQPIFQKECYSCHGRGRQKGKLRMDDSVWIMKGGKGGPLLIPTKPDASELVKRIMLPTTDEHHMPKEKPALKESQIALIKWWIEQGAGFDRKVKDFEQPGKIKTYLLALQNSGSHDQDSLVPAVPVEAADIKSMDALKEKGVVVIPVAQNSNYLMVDFINAVNIRDQDLALLVPLKKQLIWLKLGNTKIGDSSMSYIGQCQSITLLQLNGTRVSDKGLPALQSLTRLQSLNLVGDSVTASGILVLKPLKHLKNLYLYQTGVKGKDWATLAGSFPKTHLDTGGYKVSFLASDTVVVKMAPKKD